MCPKKPKNVRKDPMKTPKVWEKARREKMKIYFNELQEVLPFYDPSTPMSRFEILQKSKICIKDLQNQNQDLLNGGFDEVYRNKMNKLKQRVKELLKRVDQLTDLLRAANIMIPPLEMYHHQELKNNTFKWINQRPRKWTEKINLVVPDENIRNVLSLIKVYKKNSGKINRKRKTAEARIDENEKLNGLDEEKTKKSMKKIKKLKITKNEKECENEMCDNNDSFNGSQSPSQFKENQPVDYNSLITNNGSNTINDNGSGGVINKCNKNSNSNNKNTFSQNDSNNNSDDSFGDSSDKTKDLNTPMVALQKIQVNSANGVGDDVRAQILTLQNPTTKVGIPQTLVEASPNIVLPSATSNVLQSNTYILTNDGSLVQFPILNSPSTVLNANSSLLTPAAIIKPNARLLTPILINKPSPQVIVLQKPTTPIIQTAQILNATPQVISVPKSNIQFLNGCNPYTSSNTISNPRTLSHILSKPPGNKKRIMADSTTTTYVNKIPIAALSKHSYTKKTNVAACTIGDKNKLADAKTKEGAGVSNVTSTGAKESEPKIINVSEDQNKESIKEKTSELAENEKLCVKSTESEKENFGQISSEEFGLETSGKRNLEEEKLESNKKTKLKENLEDNFFKPIENPMETPIETDPMFCNLTLPNSINPSLSVSPTAAFLSSFPIVAPIRSETEDEVTEKKIDDDKSSKINEGHSQSDKMAISETPVAFTQTNNNFYTGSQTPKITSDCSIQFSRNTSQNAEMNYSKNNFYEKDQRCKTSEKPTDSKCYSKTSQNSYHSDRNNSTNNNNDSRNNNNNNTFDYNDAHQRTEKMSVSKSASVYPSADNFYDDNSLANKMTGNCSINFSDQNKIGYHKNDFYGKEQLPQSQQQQHQQQQQQQSRCKNFEKRTDSKCYPKTFQNGYNIFDYNYSGICYGDDDSSKYCNLQPYPTNKNKKGASGSGKKKSDSSLLATGSDDSNKKTSEQIINNLDFNPVINQECFSWMPGKNVDWFPGKSFGLEGNLMVPSTLPTLVGDLALGTTTANDAALIKHSGPNSKICGQVNLNSKPLNNDMSKDCLDLGVGNGLNSIGKSIDSTDVNKQYLEPFVNLSKNIFDMAPSNFQNPHMIKNDFIGGIGNNGSNVSNNTNEGNNSNETIVLKNIFELPVAKTSNSTSDFNMRHKRRNMNNNHNTFLSVSQLVEPPPFEGAAMKNDGHMDSNVTKEGQSLGALGEGGVVYGQNYMNYTSQKSYGKNKSRSSHCKYGGSGGNGDRKYQGYKNIASGSNGGSGSSSYTAEALIRSNNSNSNATLNCHSNIEFPGIDYNTGYFNPKPSQSKSDQYSLGSDLNIKSDFQGPNQNIYTDFNFSSPVPNFAISSAAPIDFGNHDAVNGGNFTCQNNSYFGDYIPPEYSLSDNMSNSLLIPPCSISLQSPFVIDKRNFPVEKGKSNSKQCPTSKSRKHYECSKGGFNDFSGPGTIFTTASLTCPTIFTTSACHNLLPVPTQSIPISFSSPSFTNGNGPLSFPPLVTSGATDNYHKFSGGAPQNSTASDSTFSPTNPVFPPAYPSKTDSSSSTSVQNCFTSNSVISSPFSVGCVPSLSTSTQSAIPFFSLSNPIVPSSLPTSSSNSLANFNLSTIFPEINQKGTYHYS